MIKSFVLGSIKLYQSVVSPLLGEHCRFYPSCSEYASLAVKKYGLLRGLGKEIKRILKCRPGHPGGVDLPY